jgi:hypothetical protein
MKWQPIDTAPQSDSDYFFAFIAWVEGDEITTGYGMRYKGQWFASGVFYKGGRRDQRQYELREIAVSPTYWAEDSLPCFTAINEESEAGDEH